MKRHLNVRMLVQKQIVFTFSALLILMGLSSYSSLITPLGMDMEEIVLRSPASINKPEAKSIDSLEFDCTLLTKDQAQPQMRVSGNFCNKFFPANGKLHKIENITTGHQATLFKLDNNRFTTDLIHIGKGNNQIALIYEDDLGIIHKNHLTVTR